ncbi:MAG: iron chelate uptake ABC transporter family permease subunit, partial [Micrococcus sp.]|nr:iron chelate uptake ABC transporter family permease subunit [Micrococcus sp.]
MLVAVLVRALLGDFQVSLVDAARILGGAQIPGASFILLESKLPRAVLGALVGAALGLGGALFQTLLRNPLASPDIIGISMVASASAVFALIVLGVSGEPVALAAVVGALGVALLVRVLSRGTAVEPLVVTGVVVNMLLLSAVQYLLTRADIYDAQAALVWLTGSLKGAGWEGVLRLTVALAVIVPLIALGWRSLAARELGDETATALGTPRRAADRLLALATVCVAVAVATAGPVAFVAFLAGPLSRLLTGGRMDPVAAAAVGALLVVLGDFVGGELIGDLNL